MVITVSDQNFSVIFGGVTATLDYNGETVSTLTTLDVSSSVVSSHIIPTQYFTITLVVSESVVESGVTHDTTPESSSLIDLDITDSVSFSLERSLLTYLDIVSSAGIFYSDTLSSTLTVVTSVEEGLIYPPLTLVIEDSVVAEASSPGTTVLDITTEVSVTFDKTETMPTETIYLFCFGLCILYRDGIEYTYDIRGSGDV